MATSCIIDDYVKRKRASILFTEGNFDAVVKQWDGEAQMLLNVQGIEFFKDRTTWASLDPVHFRLLITNTFNNRDKVVPIEKHFDDTEPLIGTLYFLLMGLIYSLQLRTGAAVDTIRVMRVSELDVTFEFTLTMMPEEKKHRAPPKHGLQVIVDNTDK